MKFTKITILSGSFLLLFSLSSAGEKSVKKEEKSVKKGEKSVKKGQKKGKNWLKIGKK